VANATWKRSSLARLLMPFFSTTVRAVPLGRVNFHWLRSRGIGVSVFSRKPLMSLTLFTKFRLRLSLPNAHW
jgi:hypothetical protein